MFTIVMNVIFSHIVEIPTQKGEHSWTCT